MIGAGFARDRLIGPGRITAFGHRNYRLFFTG